MFKKNMILLSDCEWFSFLFLPEGNYLSRNDSIIQLLYWSDASRRPFAGWLLATSVQRDFPAVSLANSKSALIRDERITSSVTGRFGDLQTGDAAVGWFWCSASQQSH